jgi:hypothetical protein
MPDAAVRTSTSPGPGASIVTSSSSSGAWFARITAAFMSASFPVGDPER